jgi:lysozyme
MAAADLLARARQWMRTSQPVEPAVPAPTVAGGPDDMRRLAVSIAAELCRRFEGLYLRPYLCPAGIPTIGYGATRYLDGTAVRLTDPAISRQLAERMLVQSILTTYLPAVLRLCHGIDSPQRLAAIIDWCFNLGAGQLATSTMRRRINAGRWEDVPHEIRRWNRGGGRVLRGLVIRREAEAVLI